MATRQSVDKLMQKCEDAIRFANDQYSISSTQEHYNDEQHVQALQQLEGAYNDLVTLAHSANGQQREQLHRMRLALQQTQNQMILLDR
nr:YtzC family protein [uncultured Bacillus sp.]